MDSEKKAEDIVNILSMQEEILQFEHFTNEDALELGAHMLSEAKRNGYKIAICIRRSNGADVYQAMMDGTTLEHIETIDRRYNTCIRCERSSLAYLMRLRQDDEEVSDKYLSESEYACEGGAFPIRIEEAGVIGAIVVAGANHVKDHDFIVRSLSKYLHMDEVPRIRKSDVVR